MIPEAPPLNGDFREAHYVNAEQTMIDMELDHPEHGWIPITIIEEEYPELWQEVVASGPAPYVAPPQPTAEELLERERAGMVVSRFQAKAALLQAGLLDAAIHAVAQADPVTQLAWAEAVEYRRISPTIDAIGVALDLTDEDIDALFVAAAGIEA